MPKFVEVPVYTISELSDKARDKAHSEYLSCGFDFDESDNIGTIKSFCELFDVDLQNWSVDSCNYSYDAIIPQQRDVTKSQAVAMVNQWEISQGYFLASVACDAIKAEWQNGDIKQAIENALDSMFKACRDDYEYQSGIEYFADMRDCNEWTFLESGELFHV